MAYFPMFVDLTQKECLIVGGGEVALRKVQVLLDFDAKVLVIAKAISKDIVEISLENPNLTIKERDFLESDIQGKKLVVAATSDEELNKQIFQLCEAINIPVNVVDVQDKCSFIFPSYVKENDVVGAFSSGGKSPILTQHLRDREKEIITPELGALNDELGEIREELKKTIPDQKERKKALKTLTLDKVLKLSSR